MELRSDTLPNTIEYIEGTIFNNTTLDTHYGNYFKLYFYNDSTWQEVAPNFDLVIQDIAYILSPNKWTNFRYYPPNRPNFKPGKYKLSNDITLTLEKSFYVSDEVALKGNGKEDNNTSEVSIRMLNDTLPTNTDTITFWVDNHTSADIYPLEHCFLSYYDETSDNWFDYHYPSSASFKQKIDLGAGESIQFKIAVNSIKGLKHLRKGKYRISKYVKIPVSAEFVFSSDSHITTAYTNSIHEKVFRNSAEFVGGDSIMKAFLRKNMKLPIATKNPEEYIFADCELDIDSLGQASNPHIRYVSDSSLINESLRLSKLLKDWEPAYNTRGAQPSKKRFSIRYQE